MKRISIFRIHPLRNHPVTSGLICQAGRYFEGRNVITIFVITIFIFVVCWFLFQHATKSINKS